MILKFRQNLTKQDIKYVLRSQTYELLGIRRIARAVEQSNLQLPQT
jgi:hypothetical protein